MLDRKTPPPFRRDTEFNLLYPEKVLLENGASLYLINGGTQDVIKLEIIVHGGKWHEPAPGTSHFSAKLLTKGTSKHSSFRIAEKLDHEGVHLDITPGYDFVSITYHGLSRSLPHVIDLLLEILADPSYPQNEIDQLKDLYKQSLKVNLEKTSYLASRLFRKRLFGEEHPYATEAGFDDVDNIKREQLIQFHRQFFSHFDFIISGKITNSLKDLMIEKLSSLPFKAVIGKSFNKENTVPVDQHLSKEGSVQSSIRIGRKTIDRKHQDYPELLFTNHILGGYFGSRLMKTIREEKGLTYGIHSSVNTLKHYAFLSISTDVNIENTNEAVCEIFIEIQKLLESKVTFEELEVARNHFIGSLQNEMTTPFSHADRIKTLLIFDLPHSFFKDLILKINNLTPEQIQQVAINYFNPPDFITVSAG